MSQYLLTFSQDQNWLFSFTQNFYEDKDLSQLCFDNILLYKGFLLNAYHQIRQMSNLNPLVNEQFGMLKSLGRKIAAVYSKPVASRNNLNVMLEKSNILEREVVQKFSGYSGVLKQVNWKEVKNALSPGEVAVEFVHYNLVQKNPTDSVVYEALLIRFDDSAPHFIYLTEEKILDALINVKAQRKSDYVNSLYTLADREALNVEAQQKSLYELLLKPLEIYLGGITKYTFRLVVCSHRLNLGAIPVSEVACLEDKYQMYKLNSIRNLVVQAKMELVNDDAILFGAIKYDWDSSLFQHEALVVSRSESELSVNSIDSSTRGEIWNYLAGTEREVNAIEGIMHESGVMVKSIKGIQATEESFKIIGTEGNSSPRILHLATHDYFFSDSKSSLPSDQIWSTTEPIFKISEHPMLRSGLIMAGGNAVWQGKSAIEGIDDGILTA
ncbi:MAG: CHAT domain-containing protein [Saprospiraceae bacterium]|nr:CHAT domain-containing protein [Candidatus Vicinibacter affinis]